MVYTLLHHAEKYALSLRLAFSQVLFLSSVNVISIGIRVVDEIELLTPRGLLV